MGARLAAAVLVTLVLAGCGDDGKSADGDSTPAASVSSQATTSAASEPTRDLPTKASPTIPADAPDCAAVWSNGAKLPNGYKGCVADGKYVRADTLSCSSGQGIVKYDDRFWAVRGGTIAQADDIYESDIYLDSVARCRG